ncbi:MAG: VWA domain-containing protein [Acidobacteria bacterium]|nr:VWA domain-containing protein [Acidobacteriota bacterium]
MSRKYKVESRKYRTTGARLSVLSTLYFLLFTSIVAGQQPAQPQQHPNELRIKVVERQDENRQEPPKKIEPSEDSISLETNLVVVNVTVTDAEGRYVPGLKIPDFRILEDKKTQEILSFSFEELPFAAAILLDSSGSMEQKLSLERAACANFIDGIRPGDSYSIYSFGGTKVKKLQDFTEFKDVPDSVWDMRADGNTPLYDGIHEAAEALSKRPERRRVILIVSDGADTQSRRSLDEALRKAIAAHVSIYAVDMSDSSVFGGRQRDSGAEVLKSMTARTGGRFFRSPGGITLREAFANTVDELRKQYTMTYSSTNERFDGKWREIEVRVVQPNLGIRTRQGYFAQKK